MKVLFVQDFSVQIGYADSVVTESHKRGDEVELPDTIAGVFIREGAAVPIKTKRPSRKRTSTE